MVDQKGKTDKWDAYRQTEKMNKITLYLSFCRENTHIQLELLC